MSAPKRCFLTLLLCLTTVSLSFLFYFKAISSLSVLCLIFSILWYGFLALAAAKFMQQLEIILRPHRFAGLGAKYSASLRDLLHANPIPPHFENTETDNNQARLSLKTAHPFYSEGYAKAASLRTKLKKASAACTAMMEMAFPVQSFARQRYRASIHAAMKKAETALQEAESMILVTQSALPPSEQRSLLISSSLESVETVLAKLEALTDSLMQIDHQSICSQLSSSEEDLDFLIENSSQIL